MRVVMVGNGKGGVGKTSTAVNLADCAARAGWRTLLVDLDPQGTAVGDLGLETDNGENLLTAVLAPKTGLHPLPTGRPNLDVLPAGEKTRDLLDQVQTRRLRSSDANEFRVLRHALALVKDDYDLVVLDTPPGDSQNIGIRVGLAAADYLLIPTNPDAGSLEGLAALATAAAELRALRVTNVQTIGVLLHNLNPQAKKIRADATATLVELLGSADLILPVFIRQTQKAAVDQRAESLTAWEYAEKAAGSPKWWEDRTAPTYSAAAAKLAADYHNACTEVLTRIAADVDIEPIPGDPITGNEPVREDPFDDLFDDYDDDFGQPVVVDTTDVDTELVDRSVTEPSS